MANQIDNTDDIINVSDIIERFEELEGEVDTLKDSLGECHEAYKFHDSEDTKSTPEWNDLQGAIKALAEWNEENREEYETLKSLLEELEGNGGDEQWKGVWYPSSLIRDSYFETYMDEMLEDCGDLPKDLPSYLSITVDYSALQQDYTSIEVEGVTYWYR